MTEDAAAQRFGPVLRALWLPIVLPSFLVAAGLGATLPVTPLLARELGGDVGVAGLAVALRAAGTLVLDVPAGLWVARLGDRRMMAIGAVATTLAAAATAAAGQLGVFLALLFAGGAALGLWAMARLHFMAEQIPLAVRGRGMALLGGTSRLGVFVGPAAGGLLAERFGLEAAFVVQAALTGAGTGLLLLGLARWRARAAAHGPGAPAGVAAGVAAGAAARPSLRRLVRTHRRGLAGPGLVALGLQVVRNARHLLLPLWGDAVGLGVAEIGLVVGLSSGVDMLLFHPAGVFMDRFGRRATGVPSLVGIAAGLALLPAVEGFAGLLAAGLLMGLGNGLSAGFVMTLGADLAPAAQRGPFLGLWRLVADVGSTAGPLLVGAVAQATTLATASLGAGGLGVAAAVLLAVSVGETRSVVPRPSEASGSRGADAGPAPAEPPRRDGWKP